MKKRLIIFPFAFLLSSCLCGWNGPLPAIESVSSQKSSDSSSSSESISVDPYTSPVTDISHGKPTYDKLNFAEDEEGKGDWYNTVTYRGAMGSTR